jgi:hypothetical protein
MVAAAWVLTVQAAAFLRGENSKQPALGVSQQMKTAYPFFHTSDEISSEIQRLSSSCPGLTVDSKDAGGVNVDIVSLKKEGSTPKNKMYFLFGEHARELISPESGLYFLKSLCGETDTSEYLNGVLDDTEFRVVLNGNPHSRRKVEDGDFCLRVNENGVDLNRNWDEKWEPSPEFSPADTNPGSAPFSEPETQIFKADVSEQRPTSFVTIHSGTLGMYMPWAYDMEHLAVRNNKAMMSMLRDLDEEYCQCPFGAAGKEVGYSCPGTCLDYVYDELNTSYAFAFEIYVGQDFRDDLKERWQEKMRETTNTAFVQLAHHDYHPIFHHHSSDFVQLQSKMVRRDHGLRDPDDCLAQFNPTEEGDFHQTVDNWARLYGDLARRIAADIAEKSGTPASA